MEQQKVQKMLEGLNEKLKKNQPEYFVQTLEIDGVKAKMQKPKKELEYDT